MLERTRLAPKSLDSYPTTHRRSIRWPFEPLRQAAGETTLVSLAEQVGVSPRTIWRWQKRGLTDFQADRAAVRLGLHPSLLWEGWFEHATQ